MTHIPPKWIATHLQNGDYAISRPDEPGIVAIVFGRDEDSGKLAALVASAPSLFERLREHADWTRMTLHAMKGTTNQNELRSQTLLSEGLLAHIEKGDVPDED